MPGEPELYYVPYETFLAQVREVADGVEKGALRPDLIVGIGRGGIVPAVYISHQLDVPMLSIDRSPEVPGFAEELLAKLAARSAAGTRLLFVDDINDSGRTIDQIQRILAENGCERDRQRFAVIINNRRSKVTVDFWAELIDREQDKRWFVFPWEAVADRATLVEEAIAVPERLS